MNGDTSLAPGVSGRFFRSNVIYKFIEMVLWICLCVSWLQSDKVELCLFLFSLISSPF
uniref:Uncharacterized protein n=1 Tax=Rhizophora mucronata TaxID=61149 RepID=A0A2P2IJJ3_RHIMU